MNNYHAIKKLFGDETIKSYIFHVPHSSTAIPDNTNFISERIANEIGILTDYKTNEIFDIPNTDKIIYPYSRIFCDVERLEDDLEPMSKVGRGFYYTKTDNGEQLRSLYENHKKMVYDTYYIPHHNILTNLVDDKLKKIGFAIIIDCHSFSNTPLHTDLDKSKDRPDICIGVDDYHTPKDWVFEIKQFFLNNGLTVKINSPYSGTIIPKKHYKLNENVVSIMIEINKRLYISTNEIDNNSVRMLNGLMKKLFLNF
jgi:N-formylglutamate deformylase